MHNTLGKPQAHPSGVPHEAAWPQPAFFHALRGATVVAANTVEAIHAATKEVLTAMVTRNDIPVEAIASIFFTVTPDLNAAFPAKAARQLGWRHIALMCATEIAVPGAMPSCLRVLVHFNATRPREAYQPVYLNGAEQLLADDPS
ncbi:MAG: chorismate mutase [Ktedonobacterales bacterium]|nr:chorismate mutase [Ktedonobacterales bacterium]